MTSLAQVEQVVRRIQRELPELVVIRIEESGVFGDPDWDVVVFDQRDGETFPIGSPDEVDWILSGTYR